MSQTVSGSASLSATWSFSESRTSGSLTRNGDSNGHSVSYAAGDIDKVYESLRTIAASGNLDLDLYGALTDFVGGTINVANVVTVQIVLPDNGKVIGSTTIASQASSIAVGGNGPATPWTSLFADPTDKLTIKKGWGFEMAGPVSNPLAVVDATTDTLRIHNNDASNSAQVLITILGKST